MKFVIANLRHEDEKSAQLKRDFCSFVVSRKGSAVGITSWALREMTVAGFVMTLLCPTILSEHSK